MNQIHNRDLFHILNQQYRFMAKEMNSRLSDHGLYTSQWSIIFCLERFGPMTQTAIWKYLHVEAPTITRTISRMEKSGWVERKEGKDKRERVISLTKAAKQKSSAVHHAMDRFEQDMLADFTVEEKAELQRLLLKIGTTGEEQD